MPNLEPPSSVTWGSCSFCGGAFPPEAKVCPICGADRPVRAGEIERAPKRVRRRIALTSTFRSLIVIAVVVLLAYALISAALSGAPVVTDPLTTSGTYVLGPGNYTVLSGNITGGDYIQGNYSAVTPPGMNIAVAIYNSSEWSWFTNGTGNPGTQWNNTPNWAGPIVFAAEYTDMYYFVFSNPLPASSHVTIEIYVSTEYESDVAEDGGV
ncbi:MAG: hypothetical protein WB947_01345 [Thermoplasmata archaeon]